MIEIKGNLWSYIGNADVICITTNGFTKRNGEAVMGRGCAFQAANRYPGIPKALGKANKGQGWRYPAYLTEDQGTEICSFPVKPDQIFGGAAPQQVVKHMRNKLNLSGSIPGWAAVANYGLICFSAARLVEHADKLGWKKIVIPRPGCGAGELSWDDIGPKLHKLLDDRFLTITY